MRLFRQFWRAENGQDLVEYSLLLTFVLLGSAGLMVQSGGGMSTVWTATSSALNGQLTVSGTPGSGGSSSGSTGSSGSVTNTGTTTSGGSGSGFRDHDGR